MNYVTFEKSFQKCENKCKKCKIRLKIWKRPKQSSVPIVLYARHSLSFQLLRQLHPH